MPDRRQFTAIAWAAATVASFALAASIAIDTIRTVVSLHSSLPWFDDWSNLNLFRYWAEGSLSVLGALASQFGEHRLLVPRLVFLADDLFFRGQGWLELGAILLVQAFHASLFAMVLGGATSRGGGRWGLAALIVAMMFSLKQAANFSSSFQLQFVGVFAAATFAFMLFGRVVERAEAGLAVGTPLAGSLIAAAISTYCMANGLICGFILIVLALAARLGVRIVAVVAFVWIALVILYAQGYHASPGHAPLSDALRRPIALAVYTACYLGNLAGESNPHGAAVLGFSGIVATAAAALLVMRRVVERRSGFALLGVMLFCGATALLTGTGRLSLGVGQALEQRYVTGSVVFWSAQLCFWWIATPRRLPRAALSGLGVWLAVVLVGAQAAAKPALSSQKHDQDTAADLLLLGLDDPATIARIAWVEADVQDDVPVLRGAAISIFGGPEASLFGHPLAASGSVAAPESCTGGIGTALSDPRLGQNGVRVAGWGRDEAHHRRLRRILLADPTGIIVGLAVPDVPGRGLGDWRGFAVTPSGTALTAYGIVDDSHVCRLGTAVVAGSKPPGEPLTGPGETGGPDSE